MDTLWDEFVARNPDQADILASPAFDHLVPQAAFWEWVQSLLPLAILQLDIIRAKNGGHAVSHWEVEFGNLSDGSDQIKENLEVRRSGARTTVINSTKSLSKNAVSHLRAVLGQTFTALALDRIPQGATQDEWDSWFEKDLGGSDKLAEFITSCKRHGSCEARAERWFNNLFISRPQKKPKRDSMVKNKSESSLAENGNAGDVEKGTRELPTHIEGATPSPVLKLFAKAILLYGMDTRIGISFVAPFSWPISDTLYVAISVRLMRIILRLVAKDECDRGEWEELMSASKNGSFARNTAQFFGGVRKPDGEFYRAAQEGLPIRPFEYVHERKPQMRPKLHDDLVILQAKDIIKHMQKHDFPRQSPPSELFVNMYCSGRRKCMIAGAIPRRYDGEGSPQTLYFDKYIPPQFDKTPPEVHGPLYGDKTQHVRHYVRPAFGLPYPREASNTSDWLDFCRELHRGKAKKFPPKTNTGEYWHVSFGWLVTKQRRRPYEILYIREIIQNAPMGQTEYESGVPIRIGNLEVSLAPEGSPLRLFSKLSTEPPPEFEDVCKADGKNAREGFQNFLVKIGPVRRATILANWIEKSSKAKYAITCLANADLGPCCCPNIDNGIIDEMLKAHLQKPRTK